MGRSRDASRNNHHGKRVVPESFHSPRPGGLEQSSGFRPYPNGPVNENVQKSPSRSISCAMVFPASGRWHHTCPVPFAPGFRMLVTGWFGFSSPCEDSNSSQTELLLVDAEAEKRGFLFTGNSKYLDPYHYAIAQLEPRLDKLRN